MATKLVLIEQRDRHLTAVSREVLADMVARGEEILAQRPITQAELKKRDDVFVYRDDAYFEHKAFADFKNRFEGKVFRARVLWFNTGSGVGYAEGLNGEGRWPLYACNIAGKKTWFPETACVYLDKGTEFDAEIKPFVSGSLLVCHTPGIFDAEKWARLDHKNLAFVCNEKGEAVNGLFGGAP